LKITGFSGMDLLSGAPLGRLLGKNRSFFLQDIGVCAPIADHKIIKESGCVYIEEGVRRFLLPEEPEERFVAALTELKTISLPVRACNGFLPGQLKAVGPEAKHPEILAYADTAFQRARRASVEIIVWGSGESRRIPAGFSRAGAEEQFCDLAKKTAALAGRSGVTIVLEPLNSGETNFINTLSEGAALVEAVGHPNFRLLADIYHLLREGEGPAAIEKYGKYIRHCHIAEKEQRTPPGTAGDDFRPFLKALKNINYKGRLSLECRWENMPEQLAAAVAFLKKQLGEIAAS
jgi:sugar phosphate isomerase/epimerase